MIYAILQADLHVRGDRLQTGNLKNRMHRSREGIQKKRELLHKAQTRAGDDCPAAEPENGIVFGISGGSLIDHL